MDGSDGCTDLRMSVPDNSACFVRTTAKQDGSLLLIGERPWLRQLPQDQVSCLLGLNTVMA